MEVYELGGAAVDNNELLANLSANIVGNAITDQDKLLILRRLCMAVQDCVDRLDRIERKIDDSQRNK